jgi:intracellular septation protein
MSKSEEPIIDSLKLAIDFGPLVVFAVANYAAKKLAGEGTALYWATGTFMLATLISMLVSKLRYGKIPLMLWVTGIVVTVFGGLTIYMQDPRFIKIKPTIVNLFFAAVLTAGLLMRKNFLKLVMAEAFPELPDSVWRTLAIRWTMLFVFLAAINEYIWRTYSNDIWIASKFIPFVISMLFMVIHLPLILKHLPDAKTPAKKD